MVKVIVSIGVGWSVLTDDLRELVAVAHTLIAELQQRAARIEERLDAIEPVLTALDNEPPALTPADLSELKDEIRDIVRYIARRDDIPEVRVN